MYLGRGFFWGWIFTLRRQWNLKFDFKMKCDFKILLKCSFWHILWYFHEFWLGFWKLLTFFTWMMMYYVLCVTFMCYISWIFFFCIFLYISWIFFCEAFFHLYSLQNEVDCSRMHGGFVLLTMSEKFTKWFLIKYIFEAILCLSFDIHHNIHQTFVTVISHSPSNLKVIVWGKQACTTTSTK